MRPSGLVIMASFLFSTTGRFVAQRSYRFVSAGAAAATSSFIPTCAPRSSARFESPTSPSSASTTTAATAAAAAAAAAATLLLGAASSSDTHSSAEGSGADDKTPLPNLSFPEEALQSDHYNGVSIHTKNLTDVGSFEPTLAQSLQTWKLEGKRGIWVYVPTRYSQLIPICTGLGFDFHSAQPGMVVLTRWLPASTENRLPNGPTHQVGVGAVVLSPCRTKLLVVQEQSGPASKYQLWKLPTGLCDPGEDIAAAATRELKEETGLDSTFGKILTFRQAHPGDRGSDLFFVCLMTLKDPNQKIQLQEEEIKDYKWMDIEEFCRQELWQKSPVYSRLNEAMVEGVQTAGAGLEEVSLPVGFRKGSHSIYIPSKF